jgi:hypothetical protein
MTDYFKVERSLGKKWERLAKEAYAESVQELNNTPRHLLDVGNPNHPMYDLHLFGIHQEEFLKKQYKG